MRRRSIVLFALLLVLLNGCVTARPQTTPEVEQKERGQASWYGQEFAGRTTANGEIFDPLLLTAAHRTLPFGTVVEVKNSKNGQVVLVRINDRGPFVGNRIIDLSYAAAERIGMVKDGVGDVELRILKVGAGDREPPAPVVVSTVPVTPPAATTDNAPSVAFPLPSEVEAKKSVDRTIDEPIVESVEVQEERAGTPVRKEVASDGRTIVAAPAAPAPPPIVTPPPVPAATTAERPTVKPARPLPRVPSIVLQLGAFQSLENANVLLEKAKKVDKRAYVAKIGDLHRVRVGPFSRREQAVEAREKLEAAGLSSIIVSE